jgi:acetyl esterase
VTGLTEFQRNVLEHEAGTNAPEERPDVDIPSLQARYPELAAVSTTDVAIPGRHGDVPGRVYSTGAPADRAFVWVHGGSWIGGSLDFAESHWPALVLASEGIPVLALDYSKALNGVHFPVPSDDVVDAWNWISTHPEALGVTADQLHLGGASAGADLVAGAALRLRDGDGDGGGMLPRTVTLVYPLVHSELPPVSAELAAAIGAEADGFDPESTREATLNYVGDPALMSDPYAFAANGSAAGLPPYFVLNSERDILRASGEAYAAQLAEAGNDLLVVTEPGVGHGHFHQPHDPRARASVQRVVEWIRSH